MIRTIAFQESPNRTGDVSSMSGYFRLGAEQSMPLTAVVGGRGAVGKMLRRELGCVLGQIVDIDPRSGCDTADITAPGAVERDLLESADIVVLAVHESVALAALPSLTRFLAADALLVETLSVKSRFADAVTISPPPFEVVGINPMFGPSLGMADRAVAVVPIIAGDRTTSFISLIAAQGAHITELSVEAHDRTVAALQVLPHLLILAFARAFASCELDLELALRLAPPPASVVLSLAARMAGGNPQVYSEIQAANPFAQLARESLAQAIAEVMDVGTDMDALGQLLTEVMVEFGDSYPDLLRAAEPLICKQRPLVDPEYASNVKCR
jgi:prephenate dehydrogenase